MFWAEYDYDERGFQTKVVMYGPDGRSIKDEIPYVTISSVQEGSLAEVAGIRRGDVLIHYGSWNLFQKEVGAASFEWMNTEINKNVDDSKIVIVAHPLEDMRFDFLKAELPAGAIGLGLLEGKVPSSAMELLKEAYVKWSLSEE